MESLRVVAASGACANNRVLEANVTASFVLRDRSVATRICQADACFPSKTLSEGNVRWDATTRRSSKISSQSSIFFVFFFLGLRREFVFFGIGIERCYGCGFAKGLKLFVDELFDFRNR